MADIQLLTSSTRVNTYLMVLGDLYNVYRVDLTTGVMRISTAKEAQNRVKTIDDPKNFGITTDGVTCAIAHIMSKEDVLKEIHAGLEGELRLLKTQPEITTDGYYPGVTTDGKNGVGIKRDDQNEWQVFKFIRRIRADYKPLITDQCYFSDSYRLLIPVPVLLNHLVANLGWIADPYDWQKFEFGDRREWVELPPMKP